MPNDPLSPSALAEAVKHDRAQTIGLTSCPTDEDGKECELCAEQVDRLIASTRDAVLQAEHKRLCALTPEAVVEAAAKAVAVLIGADCPRCHGTGRARYLLEDDAGSYEDDCGECKATGKNPVPRILVRAALPILLAPAQARIEALEKELANLKAGAR